MVVTSDVSPVPGTAEKADSGAINDVTIPSVDSALAPAVAMPTNVNNVNAMSTVLGILMRFGGRLEGHMWMHFLGNSTTDAPRRMRISWHKLHIT